MLPTKLNLPGIYNPANQPKEELIANFVVRVKEFKKIFEVIKADKMKTPPQHFIIQGQRGSGKTTLLLRIFHAVSDEKKLNGFLIPIIFDEEQYGIRTLFKFWEEIALYLEDSNGELFLGLYDEMRKHVEAEDYEERCYNILEACLNEHGRKLVLLIDNFGDMLAKFKKKERQRLREVLIQCPDIRIVGASAVVLEFNYDYSHPFFEFFKVFHLEGLNRKEGEKLLLQLGETYKTDVVKNIIENNPGRVEALRRITSGVPRSIILLFEIFLDNETGDSFQDLEIILDRVTPLYKHRMDGLPPQKQEIMDAIALNWDAIAVKDIAKKTRIPGKSVSAQLNELEKNRLVTKIPTSKKNNLYQVSERFFNIWYLMRNGRRRERQKVLWLVRFLESWCGEEYLIDPVNLHSQNLKEGNIKVKALSLSKRAFELVQDKEFVEKPPFILTYACVLLWNDEIEQAIQMADLFIENDGLDNIKGMKDSEITSLYRDSILLFLAKKQYHYVLKLFRENKLNFKDRLKPVYYALMVLMKDTFPDEHKKMDDELKQTVDEVIERINQMAIDYA